MEQSSHAFVAIEPRQSGNAFQKLLIAIDFSKSSTAALSYAENLARLYGSELLLAHVVSIVNASSPDIGVVYTAPEIGQAMAEDLEQLASQLRQRGIQSRAIIAEGPVAEEVERIVQKEKPYLLLAGTHGAHGLERLILGSVAESILRTVSCPVLTLGPGCGDIPQEGLALRTILYASVLRHPSETALRYAASLARATHVQVELVHVIEEIPEMQGRELDIEMQSQADMLADALKGSGIQMDVHHVYGEPVEAIIRQSIRSKADLIVLGVERGRKLASLLPAGIAYRLICSAVCPVVTLKNDGLAHRG